MHVLNVKINEKIKSVANKVLTYSGLKNKRQLVEGKYEIVHFKSAARDENR